MTNIARLLLGAAWIPMWCYLAGLTVLAAGLGWLAFVRPTGSFIADVLPVSLVAAPGMSPAFIPSC